MNVTENVSVSFFTKRFAHLIWYLYKKNFLDKSAYDSAKAKIDKKRDAMEKEVRRKEKRGTDEVVVIDSIEGPSKDSFGDIWIRPDLIIRFIDKDYAQGKLYKEKLRVVDVASPEEVTLEDDYGQSYYSELILCVVLLIFSRFEAKMDGNRHSTN